MAATLLAITFTISCGEHTWEEFDEWLRGSSSSDWKDDYSSSSFKSSSSSLRQSSDSSQQPEKWDIRKLDVARNAEYMSALEKDVVLEMNKARSEPQRYAEEYIKPQLQNYSGDAYSAAQECIDEMSNMKGVEPLLLERGLYLAARDHATDQAATGATGHTGSDGSSFTDRLARYASKGGGASAAGENISYGKDDAREIVIQLLIDAGVPSRGHRKNIMNSAYTHTGVAAGAHKVYRAMCVIDYAKNYVTIVNN
jgi:uncharacterized protein YkwD